MKDIGYIFKEKFAKAVGQGCIEIGSQVTLILITGVIFQMQHLSKLYKHNYGICPIG